MSMLLTEVCAGAVAGGTCILYAAVGESFSESAGVVNLGVEGSMLVGALAGYAVAAETGSPWLGVLGALACGALLSSVHAWFVLSRRSNQLATGLVVMFLGLGLTSLFGASYVARTVDSLGTWAIPGLESVPFLGAVLFRHDPLTYLSFLVVPAAWWLLYRSRWGLLIRGAGERRNVLETYGHPAQTIQYGAVIAGGALAGLGGAQLSLAYANAWFENMTQGRGFIAAAVVIFAARQPFKVAAGAYLFGAALALSPALQARNVTIPILENQFALASMPYVAILVVLVVLGRKRAAESPEGLKAVFG